MACIYIYNNKEFNSREELKEVLREELLTKKLNDSNKTFFVIEGDKAELELQQLIISEEAIYNYGTDEFISTNINGNRLEVIIDGNQIDSIKKTDERNLFNEDTGKTEVFNIPQLVEKERQGESIPNIRNWQEEKTQFYAKKVYDRIWNAERESLKKNDNELKEKLYAFSQRLGIKITTIENWLKDNAERRDVDLTDVSALADMLSRTIAVANKDNLNQLSEEVSHFAIEYSNDQEIVQRMIDRVHETQAYQAEAEKYRLKYSKQPKADGTKRTAAEVEQKVRKEILGQILAQKIKDNFNIESAQNSSEVGIFSQLKNLWDRFISLFKINDQNKNFFKEFGNVLDTLASQVVNGEEIYFTPVESKEVYYSMDDNQQKFHDTIEDLVERLKQSYRNVIKSKSIDNTSRKIKLDDIAEKMTYNKYGQVLNSVIAILEDDISKVVNLINRAKQQSGSFIDNIEDYDLLNAINFSNNFNSFRTQLNNELDDFERSLDQDDTKNPYIKRSDIKYLKNKISEISKQYGSIENDLDSLNSAKANKIVEKIYRDFNAPKDVVDAALAATRKGQFKDISFFKEFLYPLRGITNPIFQAISSLMTIAEQEVRKATNNFATGFTEIVLKHKIEDKDARWLKNGNTIRNPQNTDAIEKFLTFLEEDYKDKIEKLDEQIAATPKAQRDVLQEKKVKLMSEMKKAIEKQNREWLEQAVNDAKLQELDDLSQLAKSIILNRALEKRKVLDKYRLADDSIPFENISNADFNRLAEIEDGYKQSMSPYNRDGSLKDGVPLEVATDLMKYRDRVVKNTGETPYKTEDFERAARLQGINLNNPQNLTDKQKKWLQANAIYTYSENIRKQLDAEGGAVVDIEEMPLLPNNVIDEILNDFDIRYKDENGDIQTTLPNEQDKYSPENYQAIYESLTAKRQHLVAPYKIQGKPGEIDGITLNREQHKDVLDAINTTSTQIAKFKLEDKDDITIIYEGNDSFYQRLAQLQTATQQERNNFLYNEAKVVKRNGVDVPQAYQYRRARIADADKNLYAKTYQPNFKWQHTAGLDSFLNPKYNRKMAGKTVQLKLENTQLDEKISKAVADRLKKQHIPVKDGMTYRDLFIDNEFFDKFGIDQKTDFWGEKGATKNQGLFELRKFLLKGKDKTDKEYGLLNKLFQVPQVHANFKELTERGLLNAARAELGMTFLNENDDEISGDRDRITVPKRYVKQLPKPELLSNDLSRLFGKYTEAGANYHHKNTILPEIQILTERLRNSQITNAKTSEGSNLYKMLDRWLSVHLYGNLVDELGAVESVIKKAAEKGEKIAPEFLRPSIHSAGKLSPAKMLRWIYKYMRNTNLGLHSLVPVVNMINTAANTTMEHLSENQVSKESLVWASTQMGKYYAQHVADSAVINPKTKIMRLLRYTNMYITPEKMYDGITKNVLYRSVDEPLFINYRPAAVGTAGHALFSLFDSYRLIDGEFININNFRDNRRKANPDLTEKQLSEEWSKYREKSYYNFLKEIETGVGRIELDKTKLLAAGYFTQEKTKEAQDNKASFLENKMIANANKFWTRIEAQSTILDKPLIFSRPVWMFVGLHSQYFFNFLYHRFSSKQYNLLENRYEEGNYTTMGRLLWDSLTDTTMSPVDKMKSFTNLFASSVTAGMYKEGLKGLEEFEQTNVKRAGVDLAMYTATFAMFLLMNSAADDDKDSWVKQYLALLATRALIEQGSQMLPTAAFDVVNRIKSPVAGQQLLESWINIPFLVSPEYSKVIERGNYAGLSKRERELMKLSFLKNIYGHYINYDKYYRQSNLFFRSNVTVTPNFILKSIEE